MRNPAIVLMIRFAGIYVLASLAIFAFYEFTEMGGPYLAPIPFLVAAYEGGFRLHARNGRFPSSLEAWCLVFAYAAVTCILVGGVVVGLVLTYPSLELPRLTAEEAAYWGGGAFLTLVVARLLVLAASRHAESAYL